MFDIKPNWNYCFLPTKKKKLFPIKFIGISIVICQLHKCMVNELKICFRFPYVKLIENVTPKTTATTIITTRIMVATKVMVAISNRNGK